MSSPSLTARRVAERRAAHQIIDTPVVLPDPLALRIVGAIAPADRDRLTMREQGRVARALRAFMAARSRVAEDEVARRAAEPLRQYVILGAGLDTFAYRNPYSDLQVFEVDQPLTQAWKRQQLHERKIAIGSNVTFVAVDFERDDIPTALTAAGWDPRQPTVYAWLGVTMYLEPETVRAVLREVAGQRTGTTVIFDYAVSPEILNPIERLVFEEFEKRVAAAGEPWMCTFDPLDMEHYLRELGFSDVEDLGADELNARYFQDRTDGLRVGRLAHVVRARK